MPSYSRKVQIPGRTSQELYDQVSKDIERFLGHMPLGKIDIDRDPSVRQFKVKSSLFSAVLVCQDSELELTAQLSLMATPFRSKLDDGINQWLAKAFNLKNLS